MVWCPFATPLRCTVLVGKYLVAFTIYDPFFISLVIVAEMQRNLVVLMMVVVVVELCLLSLLSPSLLRRF